MGAVAVTCPRCQSRHVPWEVREDEVICILCGGVIATRRPWWETYLSQLPQLRHLFATDASSASQRE